MSTALAYSKAEAAKVAGVSEQTLTRAINTGRLRAKRTAVTDDGEPTGKTLILHAELVAWIEGLVDA